MANFPQDLILLLSVDIVGSAEFKAKSSSVGMSSDWVMPETKGVPLEDLQKKLTREA